MTWQDVIGRHASNYTEREREREQQQQRQFVAVILSHDHYHTSGVRCTYELLAVLVSS